MVKPLILVTNDDGVYAKGIKNLVEVAKTLGEVYVVAPNKPQSGMGHAITLTDPLFVNEVHIFGEDVKAWECSGTPADCVKLAKYEILPRIPDICVSGINHGSNASINVIYSGTMSAAMEAGIEGIKAIGFSLLDYSSDADFTDAAHYAKIITEQVLKNGIPENTLLNVNIPKRSESPIKGFKICRQAHGKWRETFIPRESPYKQKYFWLTGEYDLMDHGDDTDIWALQNNLVSVVPVQFDLTAHHAISVLNKNWTI